MFRTTFLIVALSAFSPAFAQQEKDPTDMLFEEILGEAIPRGAPKAATPQIQQTQTAEAAKQAVPPAKQQFQQPVVTPQNWNPGAVSANVQQKQIPAQQISTTKQPRNTVRSVSGSVSMDLIAPADINLNQKCTVRIQLKNVGTDSLDDIRFVATLPPHAKFQSARPQATSTKDGQIVFSSVRLPARSNSFIELDVVPTEKLPINIDTKIEYSNQQQIAINVRQPQLDIQVNGPQQMVLGETKQYQIVVTNNGDGIANNLRLTSEFPNGLQKVRASNTSIPTLAPGQSAQVQVTAQGLESGEKDVQFRLASTELDAVSRKAQVVVLQPELEVTATGPSVNFLNRDGIYKIEIDNPGQVDCNNVNVVLTVPQEMSVTTISRQAQYNEAVRQLTWSFDKMPAGQTQEIQLKAQCVAEGQHTCSITVTSEETIEKEFRINTVVATRPDVSISINSDDGPAQIGSPTRFEIVVSNTGSGSAEGVQIQVELPVSLAPVISDDYVINQYENSIQFNANEVKPGEKRTFTFSAVGSEQGEHVVRSRLSMTGSERQIIAEDSVYVFESDQAKVGQKLEPQIRR